MKYIKKPLIIEACRFQLEYMTDWFMAAVTAGNITVHSDGSCDIKTLEGTIVANKGDYIIKDVKGEIYPCKPDIFEQTYEVIEEEEEE